MSRIVLRIAQIIGVLVLAGLAISIVVGLYITVLDRIFVGFLNLISPAAAA